MLPCTCLCLPSCRACWLVSGSVRHHGARCPEMSRVDCSKAQHVCLHSTFDGVDVIMSCHACYISVKTCLSRSLSASPPGDILHSLGVRKLEPVLEKTS